MGRIKRELKFEVAVLSRINGGIWSWNSYEDKFEFVINIIIS